jgi:hypothetical protein
MTAEENASTQQRTGFVLTLRQLCSLLTSTPTKATASHLCNCALRCKCKPTYSCANDRLESARWLPASCSSMVNLWPALRRHARNKPSNCPIADAHGFCEFLAKSNRPSLKHASGTVSDSHINRSVQILIKPTTNLWHELNVSLESFAPLR